MTYTGKCPHCGSIVRGGHGSPIKRIDTPIRLCNKCRQPYLDDNMYEWGVISIPYKIYFIFLANNRIYGWFFLLIFSIGYPHQATIGCIIWPLLCFLWFFLTKRKQIVMSIERSTNAQYIEFLSKANYDKLAQKYDHYY